MRFKQVVTILSMGACSGKVLDIGSNETDGGAAGSTGITTTSSVIGDNSSGFDAANLSPACAHTSADAFTILKTFCAPCHEQGAASQGVPPFDFVLEVDKMIDPTLPSDVPGVPFITPGYPERSRIYQRIANGTHPPTVMEAPDVGGPLTTNELSIVEYWIADCLGVTRTGSGGAGGGSGSTSAAVGGGLGASGAGGGRAGSGGAAGASGAAGGSGAPGTGGAAGASPHPLVDAGVVQETDADSGCGVTYPMTGFFGLNVLSRDQASFTSGTSIYELAADLTQDASLTIKMTLLYGSVWTISVNSGWLFSSFDGTHQQFLARASGRDEIDFHFFDQGAATIEYFECGSMTPTRTKIIVWQP